MGELPKQYLLLGFDKEEMTSSFGESAKKLDIPAPYRVDDVGWYPLRALADAMGFELRHRVALVMGSGATVEVVQFVVAENVVCEILLIGQKEMRVSITAYDGDQPELPATPMLAQRHEGRFFVNAELIQVVFGLETTCYTTQAVMVKAEAK